MTAKIVAIHDDGTQVDITEGVQVAYDCVVHSMDWGSGFLDTEEVDAVVRLAEACQFEDFERVFQEVQRDREYEAKRQEEGLRRKEAAARAEADRKQAEHLRSKGIWIP